MIVDDSRQGVCVLERGYYLEEMHRVVMGGTKHGNDRKQLGEESRY